MSEIVEATTPKQIEQVRNLFAEYRAELPAEYCFAAIDVEMAMLPGEYARPSGVLLLATVIGQPVGCVGLRAFPLEGTCEMKRLYVRPMFRGNKVGDQLVQRVLEEARGLGYTSMRLDSYLAAMAAAVKLYRRFGFREVSAAPLEAAEGIIYMERPLTSA